MWAYSFFRMGGDCVFVLAWLRVVFYLNLGYTGIVHTRYAEKEKPWTTTQSTVLPKSGLPTSFTFFVLARKPRHLQCRG